MTAQPTLRFFVPADGSPLSHFLYPGSAIVGDMQPNALYPDLVRIDYEGNVYGMTALKHYEARLESALGRHITDYPTTARSAAHASSLVEVGHFIRSADGLLDAVVSNPAALQAWLGKEPLNENLWMMCTDKYGARKAIADRLRAMRDPRHDVPTLVATMARHSLYAT